MRNNRGFTLLELTLASTLAASLIGAILFFFAPSVTHFLAIMDDERLRLRVSNSLDAIGKDAENQRAIYVDKSTPMCYEVCMVDGYGMRTLYYWQDTTLYRKREPVGNALTCTGGQVFATDLDPTLAKWSVNGSVLNVKLGATGHYKNTYQLASDFFPWIQERQIIFSEGFECNTLRQGWVVTSGSRSSWTIVPATQHLGEYTIADADTGSGADTTSIEIALDLSRITEAHLDFNYYNSGTISAGDSYIVYLYDGTTYQQVFSDTRALSIASPVPVQVDLSGYTLNEKNKLKFVSTLSNAGARWYVDSISVFAP